MCLKYMYVEWSITARTVLGLKRNMYSEVVSFLITGPYKGQYPVKRSSGVLCMVTLLLVFLRSDEYPAACSALARLPCEGQSS